jgi:hypothetical protein
VREGARPGEGGGGGGGASVGRGASCAAAHMLRSHAAGCPSTSTKWYAELHRAWGAGRPCVGCGVVGGKQHTCRMCGIALRWMGVGRRYPLRLIALISQPVRPMASAGRGNEGVGGLANRLLQAAAAIEDRAPCVQITATTAARSPNVPGLFLFFISFARLSRRPPRGFAASASSSNSTTSS